MTETGEVLHQLAEGDPTSAEKQRELSISYENFARVLEKANVPQAMEWWRKCLELSTGMIAAGLHATPGDLRFVD